MAAKVVTFGQLYKFVRLKCRYLLHAFAIVTNVTYFNFKRGRGREEKKEIYFIYYI
jgi:hypothetical protein